MPCTATPPRNGSPPLAWLTFPENTHLPGQVIYLDGGADATLLGDTTW